uniref:Nucleoporin NUP42 n=1 Tax=Triatoma infestans TaxID=30076 RepID=A0A023F779_TRIIF
MATVCKYFLTNSCKFGDRCRYSHALPNDKYRSNPYVYDVRQKNEGVSIMQRTSPSQVINNNVDIDKILPEYLKKVIEDTNQIENHKMWPLTCYSLAKSQKNLPGWNDVSMEEVRWEAYQAQINGTTNVYLANIQELLAHAKEMRNIFLRPGAQAESILREYLKNNNTTAASTSNQNVPFIIEQPTKPQTEFSFATALEKTQPSVFNQMTTNTNSSRFFTQNLPTNMFNQVPQQQFQQQSSSIFGFKSSFESSPQPVANFFQNKSSVEESFKVSSMDTGTNIFGGFSSSPRLTDQRQQEPGKSGENLMNTATVNINVYSKVEDLSKEDYEVFKANTFTLENLPFAPPPKELCH